MTDKEWLLELADGLDGICRFGADSDKPEGARWIEVSDTLARRIAGRLRTIAVGVEAEDV